MWGKERDANEAGYETMPTLMRYAAQQETVEINLTCAFGITFEVT